MNVANQQSRIMGNIVDIFANIQNIKLFSSARFELNRVDKFQKKFANLYSQRGIYLNKYYTVLGLISSFYFILCFAFLVWLYANQQVTVGDFILIFGINNFLHNIIQDAMKQIRNFLEEFSVIKEALEVIEKAREVKDCKEKIHVSKGEIIFDKVKFSYDDSNPLFSDKSVKIKAGERVGLVGRSGSGKSTFINLLLRFYDVKEGRILIDNQDISQVSQDSLHEAIGVIPQEAILFHRNLIENISYGNKEPLNKEHLLQKVKESAQKASAHKFIEAMPDGYYSQVGERGIKLSGGQRQRIAIARAFFKNAPILVLDEATSQLDSVNENIIQESLKSLMKDKTTLVIAHRLSTLQMMDRILVFSNGKIVEDGCHEELLELNGYYKRLWTAQSGGVLTYQIEGGATATQLFPNKT
jgi:ATP-binding cassette subfamily B protein